MKSIQRIASAAVLAAALTGPAGAQVGPAATMGASKGAMQLSGKILAIDTNGKIMRLEADAQSADAASGGIRQVLDVALTDQTVITKYGADAKPEDLQFGEQVQVEYDIEQGKHIARAVSVQDASQTPVMGTDPVPPSADTAPPADAVTAPSPEGPSSEGELPSGAQAPEPPAQEPDRSATSGAQTPLSEERP